MQRAHKIRLTPNNKQASYFKRACGVRRFVYNWGLAEWSRQYKAGGKPSALQLKKEFNAVKKEQFPFVSEVTKCAAECAFMQLDRAFKGFFSKRTRYPKFKKKGQHDSFYLTNTSFSVSGKHVRIPRLGKVRMTEELRYKGRLQSAVISYRAGYWFISLSVELPDSCCETQAAGAVGIDLGVMKLATLSDGTTYENPRSTRLFERRIRRLSKSLARKQKGSANWKRAKQKLATAHYRLSCIRLDASHKLTTAVTRRYSDVCLEDLNVRGMLRNRRLAKAVADASFSEIRRQFEYKAHRVHLVDRWFPSSKLCPACGQIHAMPLSKRRFECDCGYGPLDRDLNAAQNILRQGLPDVKPVEFRALAA